MATRPQQLIDWFKANPDTKEASGQQIADLLGMDPKSINATFKSSVERGLLHSEKRGLHRFYSLRPFEVPDEDKVPFNAALWTDGDLVIYGATLNEDGSVTVAHADVARLRGLLHGDILAPSPA